MADPSDNGTTPGGEDDLDEGNGAPTGTADLRRGWTTGACATAAARAACTALFTGEFPDPVEIRLPGGQRPAFALAWQDMGSEAGEPWAAAGVIKDAGDDPDVTHGALIRAKVSRGVAGTGVVFRAGPGVGTVTRPGLPVPVGEAAINPVPRRMIHEAVSETAAEVGASADLIVEISIPDGEKLAEKTLNARLGILGGLSILGTTGIVVPYSCAAWIASIHRGIDVARAVGQAHLAACTGSTSEAAVIAHHGLPETALLDMGHFAGGTLKHLRRYPVPWLTIAGGFAKMSKLAQGLMDLHSKRHAVDTDWLISQAVDLGADAGTVAALREARTAAHILEVATAAGLPLADRIATLARDAAIAVLGTQSTAVEVLVVNHGGRIVGRADWRGGDHPSSPR